LLTYNYISNYMYAVLTSWITQRPRATAQTRPNQTKAYLPLDETGS